MKNGGNLTKSLKTKTKKHTGRMAKPKNNSLRQPTDKFTLTFRFTFREKKDGRKKARDENKLPPRSGQIGYILSYTPFHCINVLPSWHTTTHRKIHFHLEITLE